MLRGHSKARATYSSDVSVLLLLSAFASATPPSSPIRLAHRLQRGEVGQGCSEAAGARVNLLERR